jgi:hypothetical protein
MNPHAVTLGDVDGDGDLDLVTGDLNTNTASLRLNNGSGNFSDGQPIAIGTGARSVALGDIDGDGDLDLLAANYHGNTVSVRLNDGRGAFSSNQEVGIGIGSYSLVLGDLDGDGDLDFVTANNKSNTVSVRLNGEPNNLVEEISVYPNPAHLKARLMLPARFADQTFRLEIINVLGQTIIDETLTGQQTTTPPGLLLNNFATGIYILRIDTSEGRVIKRLIIH